MESAQNRRRDDAIAIGHAVTVRRHPSIRRRIRKSRPQTAVRAPAVVMGDPLPKNDAKVPLGQRDHEVQAFPTNCADYPLAERIRLWNASGRLEHFQTHRPEGSIDAGSYNALKAALNQCYSAIQKEDSYDPVKFAAAAQAVSKVMP